ncbi:MAG: mucoidy inhibitor MuiA family protein, partial [Promethearchaeota archaeon]
TLRKNKWSGVYRARGRTDLTNLQTTISKVTVFRDAARVTRTGKVKLEPGPQKVMVTGITNYAQYDSFRVKGRGPANLSSIDVQSATEVFEPSADIKPLYEELKELEKKRTEIQDEIEFQQNRLVQINNMVTEFTNHFGLVYAANEGDMKSLTDMDKKANKLASEIQLTLRSLNEELQELDDKVQVLRNNISRINSERKTVSTYTVEVSLEVSSTSNIELDVTYQTGGASWIPQYDVDLHPAKATLRRLAMVNNRTDEDWSDIDLVISTATAKPVEAIEGTPFFITAHDPAVDYKVRAKDRRLRSAPRPAAVAGLGVMAPPAPPPEIEEDFAEAMETVSGIAVYELPKKMTVPSDHERHPVTLIEEELESTTIHYWYAEGMAEVVAQDKVVNNDNVILPGKMKVFSEGDYIGETSVGQISPREEFKVGTRVAYDVKAEKKLVEREMEKAGVLRGKLRRSYKYKLEIQSFSKRKIEIDVFDRVPHSVSTQIEVKIDWDKLATKSLELGVIEWHRELEPNEKKSIDYEYEVVWEKDITISPPLP